METRQKIKTYLACKHSCHSITDISVTGLEKEEAGERNIIYSMPVLVFYIYIL